MRDQLMAGPLPRSARKGKDEDKRSAPAGPGRSDRWRFVGASALAGIVLTLLAVAALRTSVGRGPGQPSPADRERDIARKLENRTDWFESTAGPRTGRAGALLDEARAGGMVAGHAPQKTGLMRINLRTLAPTAKPQPSGPAAKGEPAESSAFGQKPSTPAPRPSDERGRVRPGTGGGDTVLPDGPARE